MARVNTLITLTPDDSVKVLAKSNAQVGNAGAAGTTLLTSYTLPGGTMGPNDSLRISTLWQAPVLLTGTPAAVVYFGSGATDLLSNNLVGERSFNSMIMIHNSNSVSAQIAHPKFQSSGISLQEEAGAGLSYSIDTTSDVVIGFQVEQVVATEVIYLESYTIELIRG